MDFKSAFSYVFQDPDWVKKTFIAVVMMLLSIFIIPAFFVCGYMIKIIRNVMNGVERPLPDWEDWGDLFTTGLKAFVVGLIYVLPLIVVGVLLFGILMVPAILTSDSDGPGEAFGILFVLIFYIGGFIINIAAYAIMPALIMQIARSESIGDALKIGQVISLIKLKPVDYVIICLLNIALQTIASFGFIIFIIGVFFTIIYAEMVKAYLFGQYIRQNTPVLSDNL